MNIVKIRERNKESAGYNVTMEKCQNAITKLQFPIARCQNAMTKAQVASSNGKMSECKNKITVAKYQKTTTKGQVLIARYQNTITKLQVPIAEYHMLILAAITLNCLIEIYIDEIDTSKGRRCVIDMGEICGGI